MTRETMQMRTMVADLKAHIDALDGGMSYDDAQCIVVLSECIKARAMARILKTKAVCRCENSGCGENWVEPSSPEEIGQ